MFYIVYCHVLLDMFREPMKVKVTPKSRAKVGFMTHTEDDSERLMYNMEVWSVCLIICVAYHECVHVHVYIMYIL